MKSIGETSTAEQAILVAKAQEIDLNDVRRWSDAGRNAQEFQTFRKRL